MQNAAAITPIGAADTAPASPLKPLSVDDAVRAALSHRAPEARSFNNEDDVEGPRRSTAHLEPPPPAP